MKKILLFFISAALAASLVACVREVNPTDDGSKTNEKVTEGDVDIDDTSNPIPSNDPDDIPAEDNKDNNNDASTDDKTDEETLPEISGLPDENGFVAVSAIMLDRYESTLHVGQIDMPWETIYPQNATNASTYWESSDPSVASVDTYGRITANKEGTCTVTVTSYSNSEISSVVNVTVTPSPLPSEPTYIDGIIIANKSYPLPSDYNPGVDPEAQSALDSMIAAASKDGISLFTVSAFRSYERQQTLYSNYLLRERRDAADRYSARPGYSEHQTGLAFDLNSVDFSFADTPEGKWLAAHCAEYGFIIRYPEGKESVTGYMYEPWHVRYLGVDTATAVYESGLTLEEYLGITSCYN